MAHRHLHVRRDFWDDVAKTFGFDGQENQDSEKDSGSANDNGDSVVTIVRTKYQTLDPTFDGEVVGHSTVKVGGAAPPSPEPTDSAELPETIEDPDLESVDSASLALATNIDTAIPTLVPTSNNGQLPAATSTSELAESNNGGNGGGGGSSTAAKAGIAIGVLAAILIVFGLVYFAIAKKRRKSERQSLDDDEKLHGPFGQLQQQQDQSMSATPPPPPAKAPRVSLRPVSQFLSNMTLDKRTSKGAAPAPGMAAGAMANERSGSAWERPLTSQSQHPANPFGNQAERIHTPIPEESPTRPVSPLDDGPAPRGQPVSPMEDHSPSFAHNAPSAAGGAAVAVAAGAAGAAAAATGGLTRQASRNYGPKHLDLTVQPPAPLSIVPPSPASPAGTEFSMNSVSPGQQIPPSSGAAAIAAAGGPASSTVHRVQLDFKPTLEDEMELRAGDLVRLLHEYDDGWALAIRLDRSRQGVVPRTCLSVRPLKPRPQPGPTGPPANRTGRPMTPQGHPRPQSPAGRPGASQIPRPASPAGGRASPGPGQPPQSPGPRYQAMPSQRSQSPNGMGGRPSPPGPSRMGPGQQGPHGPPNGSPPQPRPSPPTGPVSRKPVPGQAY